MLKVVTTWVAIASITLSLSSAATETVKDELQQKLEKMQSLTADFEQTVSADNGDILQQLTGELAIQRPDKMRWKTNPPDDTLMIASGETVWYYNPFVEQVTLYQQQQAAANSPMLLLLTGSDEQWQGYQVSTLSPNQYAVVSANNDSELRLTFNNDTLAGIWLQQQGGDVVKLALSNVVKNPSLASQLFTFEVPEGVEVDDQR